MALHRHCGDSSFKADHMFVIIMSKSQQCLRHVLQMYFRMKCHLSKLISKWIWIFSCIWEEFLAISSFFRLFRGYTLSFCKTKINAKLRSINVQIKKMHSSLVWISINIFNGNSWSNDSDFMKPNLIHIYSFSISPLFQTTSQAN